MLHHALGAFRLASGALALVASAEAHVTLLSPNGGELLAVGTTVEVSWTPTIEHDTVDWDLWYSTTGMNGPWIVIALDLPLGDPTGGSIHTYAWTVPDAVSGQVFVRVRQDNASEDYEDVSDAALSIVMGEAYCDAAPNSTGAAASIGASGSNRAADVDLTLDASGLPANEFGYFLASRMRGFQTGLPGSSGNLCLGGSILRFNAHVLSSGPNGVFTLDVDTTAMPESPPVPVVAGETWHFQAWFRDQVSSNFSDAVSVVFL
ncbi:MAG: hypothetical protein GY711_33230 [bacterium]|nr:hypothetical protein [bacterium]